MIKQHISARRVVITGKIGRFKLKSRRTKYAIADHQYR